MNKKILITAICALSLAMSGCIRPYVVPVQQGKIINQAMIDKLKPGMSEDQVKYILGSPDIIDPYHPNTWYYVYTNEKDYMPRAENQLSVHFADGKVDSIAGDYAPPSKLQYQTVTSS
jgi:outer membrane protein assembly factor BamE